MKIEKTVRCYVLNGKKVLLLKRKDTWFEDKQYAPPGGLVDDGESPKEAAVRETLEESGIKINTRDLRLIDETTISANGRQFHNFSFVTTKFTGQAENKEPHRHSDIDWFPCDELPEDTSQLVYDTLKQL